MAIDSEKNNYEMPTDVADAIKDLQPSVKAKIEWVFKAYDALDGINSSINKLDRFIYRENIRDKYVRAVTLVSKIRSICMMNDIYVSELCDRTTYRVRIADLIEITINYKNIHYIDMMEDISVKYRGNDSMRFKQTDYNELRTEATQICKLLMDKL